MDLFKPERRFYRSTSSMLDNFPTTIKQISNPIGLVSVREDPSLSLLLSLMIDVDLFGDADRNLQYQQQLSSRVSKQMNDVLHLLTRALNIHLNIEQQFTLNTSNVFMTLEALKDESLLGKEIQSVGNARLRLPSSGNLSLNETPIGFHSSSFLSSSSFPTISLFLFFSQRWNRCLRLVLR